MYHHDYELWALDLSYVYKWNEVSTGSYSIITTIKFHIYQFRPRNLNLCVVVQMKPPCFWHVLEV